MRTVFVWLWIVASATQAATAQNPTLKTRTKEQREELVAATHRITLNVQVSDATGNPISDLNAGNFTIFDNNEARKIAAFHAIDGAAMYDAANVVILLDAVNSPSQALDAEKEGIFRFLAQSHRPFSFPTSFALWFNGHLQTMPPTTDRNAVGRAFVKMTKGLHSNACDGDQALTEQKIAISGGNSNEVAATCRAVHFRDSLEALDGIAQQETGGGRTLLIWVGTGWPEISEEEFQRLSPKDQRNFTQGFVSLTHDLRTGQVTLYSISPAQGNQDGKASKDQMVHLNAPVQNSAQAPHVTTRSPELHNLSERTGGRVMASSSDIAADLGACVHDAEWYYTLSFNVPPAQNGPGEFHSLAIKVNRPGLQVRTMTAYYSEP